MEPKARITKIMDGAFMGYYSVQVLTDPDFYKGLITSTAQRAFDYCEANGLTSVDVNITNG